MLDEELNIAQRVDPLVLMIVDIDHFKSVNDLHSHQAGDLVLTSIGAELTRFFAGESEYVCRMGGEEFLVMWPYTGDQALLQRAQALREHLEKFEVVFEGYTIIRTVSIGCAVLSVGDEFSERLGFADIALIHSKDTGRNKVTVADEAFLERAKAKGLFRDAREIELALLNGECTYYAQPIVNAIDDSIEGFEALLRWEKPDGEVIVPKYFLHVLYGEFYKLKYRNIRIDMVNKLIASLDDYPSAYVSWNFQLEQFESDEFTQLLLDGIEPPFLSEHRDIVIEISERQITERTNLPQIVRNLEKLRCAGFKIALDDFGSEHSNIYRMNTLPVDIIKIDRSLIFNVEGDYGLRDVSYQLLPLGRSSGASCK